MEILDPTGYY
uniref:Tal-like protein 1A n=1 Tax=Anopheles gambiae TaxID=7165 RepID=A3RLR6_ANOGA|nr:tal-like protein 1A [Anopheles gambiae]